MTEKYCVNCELLQICCWGLIALFWQEVYVKYLMKTNNSRQTKTHEKK